MGLCIKCLPAKFLVTCVLLVLSIQIYAEQWYHIELIVFEQLDTSSKEEWPQIKFFEWLPYTVNVVAPFVQPAINEILVLSTQQLSYSSNYKVHYHKSWQQPVLGILFAQAIPVQSRNSLIKGDVLIYKKTYLHVQLDLWLIKNQELTEGWFNALLEDTYIKSSRHPNLKYSRRISGNRLYFFDHPKIGALIQLTPIGTP